MFTVGRPSMKLLRRAVMFAQPDDPPAPDPKADDPPADPPAPKEDDKPIPYARFKEVNDAKRKAETELKTTSTEVTRLKQQIEQLQATDQTAALKAAQDQLTGLQKSIESIDTEFEDMLEVALADVPKEAADMVREIPGGPRAQFAWFNKHRARLTGTSSTEEKKTPAGAKNEKKPDGGNKPEPSSTAKAYAEQFKPREKGFAGLS